MLNQLLILVMVASFSNSFAQGTRVDEPSTPSNQPDQGGKKNKNKKVAEVSSEDQAKAEDSKDEEDTKSKKEKKKKKKHALVNSFRYATGKPSVIEIDEKQAQGEKKKEADATPISQSPKVVPQRAPMPILEDLSEKCLETLERLGLSGYLSQHACDRDASFRAWVLDARFSSCVEAAKANGIFMREVARECTSEGASQNPDAFISQLKSPVLVACIKNIGTTGIDDGLLAACRLERYQRITSNVTQSKNFNSCVKKSYSMAKTTGYWSTLRKRKSNSESATIYDGVLSDCASDIENGIRPSLSGAEVVGYSIYHTDTYVSWNRNNSNSSESAQFGGLSGCSAYPSKPNQFICVSDAASFSYAFIVELKKSDLGFSYFQPVQSLRLDNRMGLDLEDIAVLPNGDFLLTSEADSYGGGWSPHKPHPEYPNFMHTNVSGEFIDYFAVADVFEPIFGEQTERSTSTRWVPRPCYNETEIPPCGDNLNYYVYSTSTVLGRGVKEDKGIEALTVDPTGKYVIYSSENELTDHKKGRTTVAVQKLEPETPINRGSLLSLYQYKLEANTGEGVSAMAALDQDEILFLERGYDGFRSNIQVFSTRISKAMSRFIADDVLRKNLVFDLRDLLPQFPAGFRADKLDNYEAMAVGPTLPDGRRTIILATDNNFKDVQATQFIQIALPNSR